MVLPGFVEGHSHMTTQGIILHGPDLQPDSMDELLAKRGYDYASPARGVYWKNTNSTY